MGNLPSLRHYRPELFTTDEWGFRYTPGQNEMPVSILFIGDSFTAGSALSDSETLSSQVSSIGQIGTYNGGNVYGAGSWPQIESLIKRLNLKNGTVVYQHSERYEVPAPVTLIPNVKMKPIDRILPRDSMAYHRLRSAKRIIAGYIDYSPLKIFLTRLFLSIQDDVWLPNLSARNILIEELIDGQPFLFMKSEELDFDRVRDVNAGFFSELDTLVRSTGNELLVILVPNKYSVYHPLIQGSGNSPQGSQLHLSLLSDSLKKADVSVLDLTMALREQAASMLAEGKYNYYADDTHWNALGVGKAAQLILASLRW